jgi:hypothetical protein
MAEMSFRQNLNITLCFYWIKQKSMIGCSFWSLLGMLIARKSVGIREILE